MDSTAILTLKYIVQLFYYFFLNFFLFSWWETRIWDEKMPQDIYKSFFWSMLQNGRDSTKKVSTYFWKNKEKKVEK